MSTASAELLIVFCTFPNIEDAGEAARTLVAEELCACVNILPGVRSIYRWNDEVVNNGELLCIFKTTPSRHAALLSRLATLHSYDVPEMVTVPASHVNEAYLRWVQEGTGEKQ